MFPAIRNVIASLLVVFAFSASLVGQQPLVVETGNIREKDPILRADGQELFFTRPDHPSNKGKDNAADIWVRLRNADGTWGRALNPGTPVNSFAHDRALALSADGTRLAVLRNGFTNYIELLERNERNWRVTATWPLPEGVAPRFDLTFDLNRQALIYSAYGGAGRLDLYECFARSNGAWTVSTPLSLLNGFENETSPQMAADGRSLYFRSGEKWMLRERPASPARALPLESRYQQIAVSPNSEEAVLTLNDLGEEERLRLHRLPQSALPAPAILARGYLAVPLAPGERTATVPLEDGSRLSVWPDAMERYALFLRDGEALSKSSAGASVNLSDTGVAAGSLAVMTPGVMTEQEDRQLLEEGIAARERALQQLDAERRRYDQAAPKTTDLELEVLRDRLRRSTGIATDTLPKGTTAKGSKVKDRYAPELAELERMKAKFRKQQEEKLRGDRGYEKHQWTDKSAAPATVKAPMVQDSIPSIGKSYTPLPPTDPAAAQQQAFLDSLRLDAQIRSGLYGDREPKAYERQGWENDLRETLPRTTPLSPEEATQLDKEYQKKQEELAALKAELQRLNSDPPSPEAPARQQWTAKGTPASPSPTTYAQPATPRMPSPGAPALGNDERPGITAGISFIPNTAYPNGAGYTGLDQLVRQLKNTKVTLEIRVHTDAKLDRRIAQVLSEERATTIRNHLEENGIPKALYKVVGYGNNLTGSGGERVEIIR